MNKTKIEWAERTWNPVTGCLHGCPYCYAARIAKRFGGNMDMDYLMEHENGEPGKLHVLNGPLVFYNLEPRKAPFPFGFEPTFHRYRLKEPAKMEKPQTIFVVSMGDLFGDWVPTSWIKDVFDACLAAPWHTYMFLTKNPHRYVVLDEMALLPHGDNFWYGTTVTGPNDTWRALEMPRGVHTFWSVEPMMGPVLFPLLPDYVIVGAETGNRKDKVVPEREWIELLSKFAKQSDTPVLWKDNIRKLYQDLPALPALRATSPKGEAKEVAAKPLLIEPPPRRRGAGGGSEGRESVKVDESFDPSVASRQLPL